MLEFEIVQELKPNAEILKIIIDYDFTIKNGKITHLKATNLKFIKPIAYIITKPVILTIFECKVKETSNKHFFK